MKDIVIKNSELVRIVKENLPQILEDCIDTNFNNPLKDALREFLDSDEVDRLIEETAFSLLKEDRFMLLIKESIVDSIIEKLID